MDLKAPAFELNASRVYESSYPCCATNQLANVRIRQRPIETNSSTPSIRYDSVTSLKNNQSRIQRKSPYKTSIAADWYLIHTMMYSRVRYSHHKVRVRHSHHDIH